MKYWEIIADNLHKAGWSLGWVSALDCEGRTIWIVDAHRDDGKRYVVRADEKLTAFVELESANARPLAFRKSDNFRFASVLGFVLGHEFLHQVVHDVGDGPAGFISQFSKLHQRRLIERVHWPALQRERRDVPR